MINHVDRSPWQEHDKGRENMTRDRAGKTVSLRLYNATTDQKHGQGHRAAGVRKPY